MRPTRAQRRPDAGGRAVWRVQSGGRRAGRAAGAGVPWPPAARAARLDVRPRRRRGEPAGRRARPPLASRPARAACAPVVRSSRRLPARTRQAGLVQRRQRSHVGRLGPSGAGRTPPILHCPSLHHASPEEPGPISRGLEGARPSHSVRRERLSRRAFERGAHPRAAAGPVVVVHSRQKSSPAAATRRAVSAPTGGMSARVPPGLSGARGARADHEMHLARAPSELLAFERWSRWTTSVDVAGVWHAAEFARGDGACKSA